MSIPSPPSSAMSVARHKAVHRSRWIKGWKYLALAIICMTLMTTLLLFNIDSQKQPAMYERSCSVPWRTSTASLGDRVCLTTLSDAKVDSKFKKAARRNFTDVLDATWANKRSYAQKHSYRLFNASSLIDTERPPSWSKILAVQDALAKGCDWVFWMDPDSLIMNSQIRIEDIIPADKKIKLIVTRDSTGYNAGMWMIQKGEWTSAFLKEWWSMTDFIRKPGDTKSGDNDAFKAFLGRIEDADGHINVAPQCAFNSYLWMANFKSLGRYLWEKKAIMDGIYKEGDFLVHFAGVDNKMALINRYKDQAE